MCNIGYASAEIKICNESPRSVNISLIWNENSAWKTQGWIDLWALTCTSFEVNPGFETFYYAYTNFNFDEEDEQEWPNQIYGLDRRYGCISRYELFSFNYSSNCNNGELVVFEKIYNSTVSIMPKTDWDRRQVAFFKEKRSEAEKDKNLEIKIGEIHNRCVITWDDSWNIHDLTTYKKLRHCVRLRAYGPINFKDVAKSYVDNCVNYAVNHRQSEYIFRAVAAAAGDIYAGGAGSYSSINLAEWINMVASETLDCLKDTDKIKEHLVSTLQKHFSGTIQEETWWEYRGL